MSTNAAGLLMSGMVERLECIEDEVTERLDRIERETATH
jgi:hypothetical protein